MKHLNSISRKQFSVKAISMTFILIVLTSFTTLAQDFKVLVFHKTNGFRHASSINAGINMITDLGNTNGWTTDTTQDASEFTVANLAQYNVVVWCNTSGDNLLNSSQRAAFEGFIQNGGGFVGIHAATDTYRDGSWPWYNDLVGGIVQIGPNHTVNNFPGTIDEVGIHDHNITDHIPQPWNHNEEYYYWDTSKGGYLFSGNTALQEVRSTGSQPWDIQRPITWYKEYDGGRSFYTALGHNASTYNNDQNFIDMMKKAIIWASTEPIITGELKKWHKTTLTFNGPSTNETATPNPFSDYRLWVTFTNGTTSYKIPGYYAADGDAANTSAISGNKWQVNFSPNLEGVWTYDVSFKTGTDIAISLIEADGTSAGFMDGYSGSLNIGATDKSGRDFRGKGRLEYVGEHYLKFADANEYFIKAGSDAPENTLAYEDFDNVPNRGNRKKSWSFHQQDYLAADASDYTWNGSNGTELLGAVKYLSDQGMNVFSFLTFSLGGDDENVFPHLLKVSESVYNTYNDPTQWSDGVHQDRFDVSRLAQWEKIFEYADKKGMYLHFKMGEEENELFINSGDTGRERKLYYLQLISRFGHHLALNWNVGEENGPHINPMTDQQRKDAAQYLKDIDPYDHNIVVHTRPVPSQQAAVYTTLLGNASEFTGASIQSFINNIHSDVLNWVTLSANSGKKWVVPNDEQGPGAQGAAVDSSYPAANLPGTVTFTDNRTQIRHKALWATLTAGGAGVEYYYGAQTGCNDLQCQDHRTRATKWQDAKVALDFFNDYLQPHLTQMKGNDALTTLADDYVFAQEGEVYVIYLPNGGSTNLNLSGQTGSYIVQWYDPVNGGVLQDGSVNSINGGLSSNIGLAPNNTTNDWVVLIRKCTINTFGNSGLPYNTNQKIEAENFNFCSTGISQSKTYLEANEVQDGDFTVRPGETVDLTTKNIGGNSITAIGWTQPSEFVTYTFNTPVPTSGLDIRVKLNTTTTFNDRAIELTIQGVSSPISVDIPNTGSWVDFQVVTSDIITLPASTNLTDLILKVTFTNGNTDLDWIEIEPVVSNVQIANIDISTSSINDWDLISFSEPFNTIPVVAIGALSFNGSHEASTRVRNVTTTGFEVQVDEWNYLDGGHIVESTSYIAAIPGEHSFGGLTVKAGSTDITNVAKSVQFPTPFTLDPIVFTSINTSNEVDASTTRITNVSNTGFSVNLQKEEERIESGNGTHASETLAYIAISKGNGIVNGNTLIVGTTGTSVNHTFSTTSFTSFAETPLLIAKDQTTTGTNPATVRYNNLSSSSVEFKIDEETSFDTEKNHTLEEIGYLLYGTPNSGMRIASNTEDMSELGVLYYPNPVEDELTIESPIEGRIIIIDQLGNQIITENLFDGVNTINVEPLETGVYNLIIQSNSENKVVSLLKK